MPLHVFNLETKAVLARVRVCLHFVSSAQHACISTTASTAGFAGTVTESKCCESRTVAHGSCEEFVSLLQGRGPSQVPQLDFMLGCVGADISLRSENYIRLHREGEGLARLREALSQHAGSISCAGVPREGCERNGQAGN